MCLVSSLSIVRSVSCVHVLSPFVKGTHTASSHFPSGVRGEGKKEVEEGDV